MHGDKKLGYTWTYQHLCPVSLMLISHVTAGCILESLVSEFLLGWTSLQHHMVK